MRRTGNMALDIALAVSVPLLVQGCSRLWNHASIWLWDVLLLSFPLRRSGFYRCITYEMVKATYGRLNVGQEGIRCALARVERKALRLAVSTRSSVL